MICTVRNLFVLEFNLYFGRTNETSIIHQWYFWTKNISEPLGILLLASILRHQNDTEVCIYDPCINGDNIDKAVKVAESYSADIIGISVLSSNSRDTLKFVNQLRKNNSNCIIVVGGHGPSLYPESFLNDEVDAVFIGESEVSWPLFMRAINTGKDYFSVPGIAYKNTVDGSLKINSSPPRIDDLDSLPMMARDTLPLLKSIYGDQVAAQILSSRGCYMNCSYCSIKAFSELQEGCIYRERSIASIVDEMQYLYNTYNIKKFRFADDNFMPANSELAEKKIEDFCEQLQLRSMYDIKFHITCRPDTITAKQVKKLMQVGLYSIFLGIESVNESDLKLYHRKGKTQQIVSLITELETLGFSCDVNANYRIRIGYITFNPYSTRETLTQSMKFLRSIHASPKKLTTSLKPYYKTKIREQLEDDGLLTLDSELQFADAEIKALYETFCEIFDIVMAFRERVRTPIKMQQKLGVASVDDSFEIIRSDLDTLCYDAFEKLLKSPICEFDTIKRKYIKIVDQIKSDTVLQKLDRFEQEFGLKGLTNKIIHNIT